MSWLEEVLARRRLHACNALGRRPVVRGAPMIYNTGKLVIGDDFSLNSVPIRSHLVVTGSMRIGNRVRIGAGATVSCLESVEISDDVIVGAFVIILDSDYHMAEDVSAEAIPRPVRIAEGVRIGHHVTILPGSTIGKGARLRSGSVVSGEARENAVLEGNPARPAGNHDFAGDARTADVPKMAMQVLGLSRVPGVHDGPMTIPEWDSLGALRLIVALEETYGIALSEDEFKGARTLLDLMEHIEEARRRKSRTDPHASPM
jgi:acetyltransferase-like isoleucine patch superfamily enzyme